MSASSTPCLNPLIVTVGRSFLQYVRESWPWAGDDALSRRDQVLSMAGRQQCDVARLVNEQLACGYEVDFGTFPTEYTDLHYIDLDNLLDQLVSNQKKVVSTLEDFAGAGCESVATVLENQRMILSDLTGLCSSEGVSAG